MLSIRAGVSRPDANPALLPRAPSSRSRSTSTLRRSQPHSRRPDPCQRTVRLSAIGRSQCKQALRPRANCAPIVSGGVGIAYLANVCDMGVVIVALAARGLLTSSGATFLLDAWWRR
jgi:hypothetical protein